MQREPDESACSTGAPTVKPSSAAAHFAALDLNDAVGAERGQHRQRGSPNQALIDWARCVRCHCVGNNARGDDGELQVELTCGVMVAAE